MVGVEVGVLVGVVSWEVVSLVTGVVEVLMPVPACLLSLGMMPSGIASARI